MYTVVKENREIAVNIIRKNNKNTYFRVRSDHVEVTTHHKTDMLYIQEFILDKFDVFESKLIKNQVDPTNQIKLWGNTYFLITHKGRFKYEIVDDFLIVHHPKNAILEIKKAIYLDQIQHKMEQISHLIHDDLKKHGFSLSTYRYRFLKSKYGSYHRLKNEITLNSFLAQLDIDYLKYVIYHEYAHQKVFNHSKSFYRILLSIMPDYKRYQKALKNIAIH